MLNDRDMDAVFQALGNKSRRRMLDIVKEEPGIGVGALATEFEVSRIAVMKDGILQQVDSPQHLYDHPQNVFVAGFIGSPQMNIFEGVLKKEGDLFKVVVGKDELIVPSEKNVGGKLDKYIGKKVKAGIRPEDVNEAADVGANHFKTKLDNSEMMGSEVLVYFEFAGSDFIGKFDPDTKVKPGDDVMFGVNTAKVHLFDIETGNTITN